MQLLTYQLGEDAERILDSIKEYIQQDKFQLKIGGSGHGKSTLILSILLAFKAKGVSDVSLAFENHVHVLQRGIAKKYNLFKCVKFDTPLLIQFTRPVPPESVDHTLFDAIKEEWKRYLVR